MLKKYEKNESNQGDDYKCTADFARGADVIAALAIAPAVMAQSGASTLDTAKARMFLGEWTLTIQGGRGPQERPLII
jgi:hypothetical protein